MKKFYLPAIVAVMGMSMASCSDDDKNIPQNPDAPETATGLFVLNQGNFYNAIDGSLNLINFQSGESRQNAFKTANGRSLGDTPQCGTSYGSKTYVGVYESNTIEIIDANMKSVKQIRLEGNGKQPRSIVAHEGKVYISMYDGYVARLDTATLTIDKTVQVGPNPEIIAIYNGKIYVPNSDGMNWQNGYGKTASEIDIATFTVTKTFEVPVNPDQFYATEDGLFLLSKGNYIDVSSNLYKINSDYTAKEVAPATIACIANGGLMIINDPFYGAQPAEYSFYDSASGQIRKLNVEKVEYPNAIYYDEINDKVFVASYVMNGQYPSYDLPGYVNEYDSQMNFIKKYDVGAGPACMFNKYQ